MNKKYILNRVGVAQIVCFIFLFIPVAHADKNTLETIKGEFVTYIGSKWSVFKVSEIVDRNDDKRQFLINSLGDAYQPRTDVINHKEIFISRPDNQGHLHLGAILLSYSNAKEASAAYQNIYPNNNLGYFGNTKILTQYKVFKNNSEIVITYSETFIDEKIKVFFNEIHPFGTP